MSCGNMSEGKFKNHKGYYDCPIKLTLDTIGGKWKILIMYHLLKKGAMRFSLLKETLTGVTDKILIAALRDMEVDGLVNRKVYQVVPPKVEYSLTEKGGKYEKLVDMMSELGKLYRVED